TTLPPHLPELDGQGSDAGSGDCEDGVGDGGGGAGGGGLPDAAGGGFAGGGVPFHLRPLVGAQDGAILGVSLLYAAAVDGVAAFERGGQAERDAALDLLFNDAGVDDLAAIHRTHYPMHL